MNAPRLWSVTELNQLDSFLLSDDSPENCMDSAMLDGFICAAVSGPNLIMPGELLRWVWDTEQGQDQPNFKNQQQAETIIGLIMGQWNAVNDTLNDSPHDPPASCRLAARSGPVDTRLLARATRAANRSRHFSHANSPARNSSARRPQNRPQ